MENIWEWEVSDDIVHITLMYVCLLGAFIVNIV